MNRGCPTVSVIVPIYNVEQYLPQCIDSIRTQTYSKLEILLVEDGSPDHCGEICERYAAVDHRIVVIHKKNGGLSSARNAGLDMAKGDYISFVDGDDTINPEFIQTLVELCITYDCDIAQCDFLFVAENSLKLPVNPQQSIHIYNNRQSMYELCCTKNAGKYVVAWNKLYKRSLFTDLRFPVGKLHEDEFTTYLLLWRSDKTAVINQYLYYYLQRATSIMGKPFSIRRLDILEAYRNRLLFLEEHKLWCEYLGTAYRLLELIQKNCKLIKENLKGYETIWSKLSKEETEIQNIIEKFPLGESQIERDCVFPKQSKIVLYGAGDWGQRYYKWMKENQYGIVVGWIDHLWNEIKENDFPVEPIDALLNMKFDYVFIAINRRLVQAEVAKNLISWGIPKEKILFIAGE